MNSGMQYYVTTLLVLFGINVIAIWGLDLQFGMTGIFNFAYIVFQSVGAYTAAVLSLGTDTQYGGFQKYIGGLRLPFPLPLLGATAAGGILAVALGFLALRRLRGDYQALVMLVISVIATGIANAQLNLVNGPTGLSLVPQPLSSVLSLSGVGYQWFYVGLAAAVCLVAFWIARGIADSPFGRVLRAVRDNETAAAALGRRVTRARMTVFVIGGCLAGLSGGLLVEFIGAWGPASWLYPETFLFFTAIIVGGTGNMLGNVLGALLVPIAFVEGTRFLPAIGYPGLIDSLDWVVIGLLLLAFLWFRPKGILPERRRVFPAPQGPMSGGNPQQATLHPGDGAVHLANDPYPLVNEHPPMAAPQHRTQAANPIAASPPLLAVDGLHRSFGVVQAVAGASFTVQAGTITGLVGPNGAGKSTVMSLIGGQLRPTAGRVLFQGVELSGERPHRTAERGLIRTFQTAHLFGRMTVIENLLLGAPPWRGESVSAALLGKWSWRAGERQLVQQAREVLARFQMENVETEYAANLSGGQKRIVEIMRALMARPRLLLLDEPMAGVNPALTGRITDHLEELRSEGITMLMVEHELAVVERICDPVIVMAQGRVLAEGSMADLRANQEVVDAYLAG